MTMDNISFETVIVVGCICTSIITILFVILVVLCCKRRRARKMFLKMNRLNDQMSMDPLKGMSRMTEDQMLHRMEVGRSSRILEDALPINLENQNGLILPLSNEHLHLHQGSSSLHRDHNIHSSMLSVDQRPKKILYEVVV